MIPFFANAALRRKHLKATVTYAHGQKLDIWAPESPHDAPVLMYIPGGAWTIGDRRFQGYGLMSHLVEQGWICVSVGYRTAPLHRWPDPFDDVKAAWRWVNANIHHFGGSSYRIVSGASAGGHMASLLGLTDTTYSKPNGVISFYGAYDWASPRADHWLLRRYVETVVADDRTDLRAASPLHQIHAEAPPFLILHGGNDLLTPVSGARQFFRKLDRHAAVAPDMLEIPGAVHGFDLVSQDHTDLALDRIDEWNSLHYWEMAS